MSGDKRRGVEVMQTMARPLIEMHIAELGRGGSVDKVIEELSGLVARAFKAGYDVGQRESQKGGRA